MTDTPPGAAKPGVLEEDHGDIRIIALNVPEKRNALDLPTRLALLRGLRAAEAAAKVVVLTGTGAFFSAGGDIRSMSDDAVEAMERLDVLGGIAHQLIHSRVPIVVAVDGGAFGMGLALVCGATYVVSARDARFEASFVKIGLAPDTGLSWTLPRRIGFAKARQMMLALITLQGEEALEAGLVDELVDEGATLPRAIEVAEQLSRLSAPAVAGVTRLLSQHSPSLEGATIEEARLQLSLLRTPESQELRRAFLDRRRRGA